MSSSFFLYLLELGQLAIGMQLWALVSGFLLFCGSGNSDPDWDQTGHP
jgi:hypothetical protein